MNLIIFKRFNISNNKNSIVQLLTVLFNLLNIYLIKHSFNIKKMYFPNK